MNSPQYKATKNQSNDYLVKHVEINLLSDKPKKPLTKKQKAQLMSYSSSINMLPSYQSEECPKRAIESSEFPGSKGNKNVKRALNQSQVFAYKVRVSLS